MLELLMVGLFCWLFFKAFALAFRLTWGVAKIAASLLFVIALPLLVCGLLFAGGLLLLVPVALAALAFALLKAVT